MRVLGADSLWVKPLNTKQAHPRSWLPSLRARPGSKHLILAPAAVRLTDSLEWSGTACSWKTWHCTWGSASSPMLLSRPDRWGLKAVTLVLCMTQLTTLRSSTLARGLGSGSTGGALYQLSTKGPLAQSPSPADDGTHSACCRHSRYQHLAPRARGCRACLESTGS